MDSLNNIRNNLPSTVAERLRALAKSKRTSSATPAPKEATEDKLAKAAMSREMLAAGLAAAAAAISASPAARRKIRDAGLEAADTAQAAASTMVSSASKLGSLIAEAVADAAQRVLTGKWTDDSTVASGDDRPVRTRRSGKRNKATPKPGSTKKRVTVAPKKATASARTTTRDGASSLSGSASRVRGRSAKRKPKDRPAGTKRPRA